MNLIFFKSNIKYVLGFVRKENYCAFWFSKGLTSYSFIDEAVKIDAIKIERLIYDDFKKEYPELIQKYPCEVFNTAAAEPEVLEGAKKMCFFASSDTIIKSFKPILDNLEESEYDVFCRTNENALAAASRLNIKANEIKLGIPHLEKYSLLVLCNDWGPLEQKLTCDFLLKRINVVCIQESSINFNPIEQRMRYCSLPVFQGVATLGNLDINNKVMAVIGNPRFEQLEPTPAPAHKRVLVNVNFTYGIFEEFRQQWVTDVVESCNKVGVDFVLSQHPRDNGVFTNLNVIKSNPFLVHDSIRESSVVISRFSALLTEAVCLGRPAIYYNPHGENMHYKFTTDNAMIFYVTSKDELETVLSTIILGTGNRDFSRNRFLKMHLGNTSEKKSSEYIAKFLRGSARYPIIKRISPYKKFKILWLITKLILRGRPY